MDGLWQLESKDAIQYFTLEDLWDNYYEWSACGAGVPVLLNNGESAVKYYAPYLSAIQIFTTKSHSVIRNASEDSECDSWSDDSESEKLSRSWDATSEDSGFDQDPSCPPRDRLGPLYMQYFENSSPYGRIPLMDKVSYLSYSYKGEHEGFVSTLLDLSYYLLVLPRDVSGDMEKYVCSTAAVKKGRKLGEDVSCISFPPFGLTTYKMQANLWNNPDAADHERILTLYNAAGCWLKQLGVQHHDTSTLTLCE